MRVAYLDRASRGHGLLTAPEDRFRSLPTPSGLARRRLFINITKLALPAFALALLGTIAIWPEYQREEQQARVAMRSFTAIQGATVVDARYKSVDEHGRPYTITATTARQVGPNRVDLTDPKGDITLQNGTWLMLQGKRGVYLHGEDELDLSRDVTLYRDDGTTLLTDSAAIDLKRGAAGGSAPVHAEGPFGRLDAAGGFTAIDKGSQILFSGPAHVLLNGANAP
jgi:lipopolysaccharide export system protein LptC